MAKTKSHEELVAEVEAAKEVLKTKRSELREFKQENDIKKDKRPEDAKISAKLDKLSEAVDKAEKALEIAREAEKEARPKKEKIVKYDYPEGMTDDEKKKFRAKARRDSAAKEKAEKPEKKDKAEKKEEKPEKKVIKKQDKED